MIRFEPRDRTPAWLPIGARLAALAAALLLAALPLMLAGAPVLTAYRLMAEDAAGTVFAVTETLTRATPLLFTGLAATVAFRARLFNIGGEGQLYAGALAAVMVGAGVVSGPRRC